MPCKRYCKEGQKENSPGVCPGPQCNPKKEEAPQIFKPCPNITKCPKRESTEENKNLGNNINEFPESS